MRCNFLIIPKILIIGILSIYLIYNFGVVDFFRIEYIYISIVPLLLFMILTFIFDKIDYLIKLSNIVKVEVSYLDSKNIKKKGIIIVNKRLEKNIKSLFASLVDLEININNIPSESHFNLSDNDIKSLKNLNYSFGSYYKLDKSNVTSNTHESYGNIIHINPSSKDIPSTVIQLLFKYYGWKWIQKEKHFLFVGGDLS